MILCIQDSLLISRTCFAETSDQHSILRVQSTENSLLHAASMRSFNGWDRRLDRAAALAVMVRYNATWVATVCHNQWQCPPERPSPTISWVMAIGGYLKDPLFFCVSLKPYREGYLPCLRHR
jgi:hypothetical protein